MTAARITLPISATSLMCIPNVHILKNGVMQRGAYISLCGIYRYWLIRRWAVGPIMTFIMLNPSTGDHLINDMTIMKCIGFAKLHGFSAIIIVNLFAFRTPKPAILKRARDIVGPENDRFIKDAVITADRVVCAWGRHGKLNGRDEEVLAMLLAMKVPAYALRINGDSSPAHPLMLPYAGELIPYHTPWSPVWSPV